LVPVLASLAVGIFRRLEGFLERLVEAPAGRLGAATQPATLGKRIERAMDTNKRFSEGGVIVPNRYVLHLNPADYAPFDAYHGSLEDDLAHDALTRARRLGYRLVARPRVVLRPDPMVPRGEVRVAAAVADEDSAAPPAATKPKSFRPPSRWSSAARGNCRKTDFPTRPFRASAPCPRSSVFLSILRGAPLRLSLDRPTPPPGHLPQPASKLPS